MPIDVDELDMTFDELDEGEEGSEEEPSNVEEDRPENEMDEDFELEEEAEDVTPDGVTEEDEEETIDEEEEEIVDEDVEEDEDSEEPDVSFVEDLGKQFGLPEEELESYDDTWDDAMEVTRKAAENMAQQQINQLFEEYPDIAQFAQYRQQGGDPQEYYETVLNRTSYEDLEISEDDTQTQEQLVRQRLEVQNTPEDQIDEEIQDYKDAGLLKRQAERSKRILQEHQEKRQQELLEEQKRKAEEQRQQALQEQKEYKQIIEESNDLNGIRLPENEKQKFQEYLFEPADEDGMTQAEKKYQNLSKEDALALDYLIMKDLDLGKLVDNLASTKKAGRLSDRLKKSKKRDVKDKSSRGSSRRRNSGDGSLESFDPDSLLGNN
jgi:hypothetical protein